MAGSSLVSSLNDLVGVATCRILQAELSISEKSWTGFDENQNFGGDQEDGDTLLFEY